MITIGLRHPQLDRRAQPDYGSTDMYFDFSLVVPSLVRSVNTAFSFSFIVSLVFSSTVLLIFVVYYITFIFY